MNRKDYIALAQAVSSSCDNASDFAINTTSSREAALLMAHAIASQIGNILAADNPRFDWARWINACNTGAQ